LLLWFGFKRQLLPTSNNKRQHIESQKEKGGPRLMIRCSYQVHKGNSSIPGKAITWKQNLFTNGPSGGTQIASCAGGKWKSPKYQLPSRHARQHIIFKQPALTRASHIPFTWSALDREILLMYCHYCVLFNYVS